MFIRFYRVRTRRQCCAPATLTHLFSGRRRCCAVASEARAALSLRRRCRPSLQMGVRLLFPVAVVSLHLCPLYYYGNGTTQAGRALSGLDTCAAAPQSPHAPRCESRRCSVAA